MKVYVIAAVAQNRAIGYQNKLLYWLPNDLKNFKSLTSGHTIIMGRNTFESLPKGALPNRKNVVLTQQNITLEGCEVYHSLEEALSACQNDEKVFIIGGGKVYEQCLDFAEELILTEVNDVPEHPIPSFLIIKSGKKRAENITKKTRNTHSLSTLCIM